MSNKFRTICDLMAKIQNFDDFGGIQVLRPFDRRKVLQLLEPSMRLRMNEKHVLPPPQRNFGHNPRVSVPRSNNQFLMTAK